MTFLIDTTGYFYTPEQAQELSALGFKFNVRNGRTCKDGDHKYPRSFDTLEELVSFIREWGGEVVLTVNSGNGLVDPNRTVGTLEIYDDYRE